MAKRTSEDALDKFVSYWEKQGKFDRMGTLVLIFPVLITYCFRGVEKSIETEAQLYWEGHRIELMPSGWLDHDTLYLGFDPQHQKYAIQPDHGLRIRGTGEKVGGDYRIDLLPV